MIKNKRIEESLKRKIKEVVLEVRLESDFLKGLDILKEDVNSYYKHRRIVKEELSTAIGLIMSGPFVVKLFGKFVKYLDGVAKKYIGKGFNGEQIGKKIIEFADKYHDKVMWIFEKVAGMLTKDPEKKETIAEILFTCVMAGFLAHSVHGISHSIESANLDSGVLSQGIKAAVKAGEVYEGIVNSIKALLPKIMTILKR